MKVSLVITAAALLAGCSKHVAYVPPTATTAASPEEKCYTLITSLCDQMIRCSDHYSASNYYEEMDRCRTYIDDTIPFTMTHKGRPFNRPPKCSKLEKVGPGFDVCIRAVRSSCEIPNECWKAFAED